MTLHLQQDLIEYESPLVASSEKCAPGPFEPPASNVSQFTLPPPVCCQCNIGFVYTQGSPLGVKSCANTFCQTCKQTTTGFEIYKCAVGVLVVLGMTLSSAPKLQIQAGANESRCPEMHSERQMGVSKWYGRFRLSRAQL